MPMPKGYVVRSLADRLWDKVMTVPYSGCWIWMGALTPRGYGVINRGGRGEGVEYAHRIAYQLYRGAIPAGRELDHRCRTRSCCNPNHLEPVTRSENNRRGLLGCLGGYWGKNAKNLQSR